MLSKREVTESNPIGTNPGPLPRDPFDFAQDHPNEFLGVVRFGNPPAGFLSAAEPHSYHPECLILDMSVSAITAGVSAMAIPAASKA